MLQRALGLSRSNAEAHLREIESSTIAIAFLGTPSFGADLAPLAESVAKLMTYFKYANVDILSTLNRNSEILANTRKDFLNILRLRQQDMKAISITCFFEELPLPVVGAVCHADFQFDTIFTEPITGGEK